MGLFDFLFGGKPESKVELADDKIWMTTSAKWSGLRAHLQQRIQAGTGIVVLVAHFEDTLRMLQSIAQAANQPLVTTVLADSLSVDAATAANLDEDARIDLIVGERHPSLEADEALLGLAEQLPCPCRMTYYVSLEDPLLKLFSGEWAGGMLQRLGMAGDEAIESRMITRQIKHAQQKIQSRVFGTVKASSAEEWIRKNVSDGN
jgi:preprotein translocase subunit SecA